MEPAANRMSGILPAYRWYDKMSPFGDAHYLCENNMLSTFLRDGVTVRRQIHRFAVARKSPKGLSSRKGHKFPRFF